MQLFAYHLQHLILFVGSVSAHIEAEMVSEYFSRSNISSLVLFTCSSRDELSWLKYTSSSPVAFYSGRGSVIGKCELNLDALMTSTSTTGIYVDYDCACTKRLINDIKAFYFTKDCYSWLFWSVVLKQADLKSLSIGLQASSEARFALSQGTDVVFYDVYRITTSLPVITTLAGHWNSTQGFSWVLPSSKYQRRTDFQNVTLQAGMTLVEHDLDDPELFAKLKDFHHKNKSKDIGPKIFSQLWGIVREIHNFNINITLINSYGYDKREDGSYGGITGLFQANQIDFALNGIGMFSYRWDWVEFNNLVIFPFRSSFFFLQPRNLNRSFILIVPFRGAVWLTSFLLLILAFSLIYTVATFDKSLKMSIASIFLYVSAILSQQGAVLNSKWLSGRFVIFTSLCFGYILYNYYSGQVVSELLAYPPTTITTLEQIVDSPFLLATENFTFFRIRHRSPKFSYIPGLGRKVNETGGYLQVEEGIHKIRSSVYAFETEDTKAYDEINKVFSDSEICSLGEVPMPVVDSYMAFKHRSPFKEFFSLSVLITNERGLLNRLTKQWRTAKPVCRGPTSITPVDLENASIAFLILLSGAILACIIFTVEAIFMRRTSSSKKPLRGQNQLISP